jgi:hydrogenase maturation protein HypF
MDSYTMCSECNLEYSNPIDRRFYSQTNSCPNCSIKLKLIDNYLKTISSDPLECIDQIVQFWKAGKIVAIKGLGGYILTCDANNEDAIKSLRLKKRRPSKPFALMLAGEDAVKKDFEVSEMELKALKSPAAPIVLLKKINRRTYSEEIAPGLTNYGIMLPSTPLQVLLLNKFTAPIVATSGNIHNIPIIHKNKVAEDRLFEIADYLLEDDREIIVSQDDSVIKFTPITQQKIILRRSKGSAPTYINPKIK